MRAPAINVAIQEHDHHGDTAPTISSTRLHWSDIKDAYKKHAKVANEARTREWQPGQKNITWRTVYATDWAALTPEKKLDIRRRLAVQH